MMRTANPALNENAFKGVRVLENAVSGAAEDRMTLQGTVNKTGFLIVLTIVAAMWSWNQLLAGGQAIGFTIFAAIAAFVISLVTIFKKSWAPVTAPLYALFEGLVLGSLSAAVNAMYPGIAIQAVTLTFGTLAGLLMAYRSGLIKVTENFKLGVFAATGGIALFYLISMVVGFFGVSMPLIHSSGIFGIGFSLVVVGVAALNLVLDFDFIEHASEQGLPKYMEWYAGFGLLVTLVWLYVEILRLLMKLRSRQD
jgi:uncharacterized YccA/Bax inhibitor family protein